MTALMTFLSTKLGIAASGLVASVILWITAKAFPAFAVRKLSEQLNKLFESKDPDFKEWLLATVKYAEKKFPDRGAGKQRMDFVVKLLTMGFSKYLKADQIMVIVSGIEEAIFRMDDELKKTLKEKSPFPI